MKVILLLQEIRKTMCNFQDKRYVQHNMLMMWKKCYDLKQQPNELVQEHCKRFKLQVKVVESVRGSFGRDDQLLTDVGFKSNNSVKFEEMKNAAAVAKQKHLVHEFIYDADHVRCAHVKDGLHSDCNKDYEKRARSVLKLLKQHATHC